MRMVAQLHISEFQGLMRQLYFHRDSKRGVKGTFDWLVEEVGELEEALHGESKKALEEEFADVIAWLASLANITGIDLEQVSLRKYPHKCPKCGCSPCQCTF